MFSSTPVFGQKKYVQVVSRVGRPQRNADRK